MKHMVSKWVQTSLRRLTDLEPQIQRKGLYTLRSTEREAPTHRVPELPGAEAPPGRAVSPTSAARTLESIPC